jgi:putative membrane protein
MPEDTLTRDELARQRTGLANERTLLAYVRTALAFLLTGVGLLKFFASALSDVLGWISLGIGPLVLIIGAWRFFQARHRIDRIRTERPS